MLGIWRSGSDIAALTGQAQLPHMIPVINGKSWPYTERLTYSAGEPVRWRWINASDSDAQHHSSHVIVGVLQDGFVGQSVGDGHLGRHSVRTVIDVVSVTPHWRMARSTALIASGPPLRTKAKRVACPSRSSAFPAVTSKFRSGRWCRFLTYPPSNPTINSLHGLFDEPVANTSAEVCSRFPTFIVRLRTVPAVA